MTSRPHRSGGVDQRPKFRRQAYFAHCWVPMPHDVPGTQQGLRSTAHPQVSLSPVLPTFLREVGTCLSKAPAVTQPDVHEAPGLLRGPMRFSASCLLSGGPAICPPLSPPALMSLDVGTNVPS